MAASVSSTLEPDSARRTPPHQSSRSETWGPVDDRSGNAIRLGDGRTHCLHHRDGGTGRRAGQVARRLAAKPGRPAAGLKLTRADHISSGAAAFTSVERVA